MTFNKCWSMLRLHARLETSSSSQLSHVVACVCVCVTFQPEFTPGSAQSRGNTQSIHTHSHCDLFTTHSPWFSFDSSEHGLSCQE